MGQQFAHITQQGNVKGWGAWVQGGYELTPHWVRGCITARTTPMQRTRRA